ncbi:N-acetylmuramoyl-L-alanine amidase family protein [Blautia hansenii]|uniref:N-acetylmuramoyl-L-alanine amidase family protein n=1 Tax=Blautia hansenii TaxID=1322 RepID=UPI002ED0DB68
MKSTIWKRFGSILMVLIMVFTIIPDIGVTVKAQPRENETAQGQDNTYPISVTTAEGYVYASIKNEDGTTERVNKAVPGEKIYLEFSDWNMTPGTGFAKWVDDNGNLTDLTNETNYFGCSFTMPEGEVKIHAELAQNCPTVIVENGRIMLHEKGEGFYILNSSSVTAGREIYLDFDESKTPENKIFKEWYVKSGNVELNDPTSMYNCKFIVPNEDVEIGVIYDDTEGTYPISVTAADGYPSAVVKNEDGTIKRVDRAVPGEKIHLEFSDYDMTSGTGFARWVDDNGNLTDLTNETSYYGCSFTMPEGEVKIHAELAQNCPTVTVENGRIMVHSEEGDFYILNSSSVIAGREIYLDFDESKTPENKIFKEWYVKSGNVELSDPTNYNCKLTVPNEDVEIGVIYDDTEGTYPISVTAADGYPRAVVKNEDGTKKQVDRAAPGEEIYLEFSDYDMTPRTGFVRWVDDNGNLADLTNETSYYGCSFTMPEGEVKIHAELAQNCPTVTVGNGRIMVQSEERAFYILSSSAVTAGREIYLYFDESKTPENKVFKEWYVKSGNAELSAPTSMYGCNLTVPNEDVEIGVIYETETETGWQSDSAGWWYNDENGNYVTDWKYIDGKWYYFASNGYMQTGWVYVNGHYYYMDQSRAMCTGWVYVDGHYYYMDQWGAMCTGWVYVNGHYYYMDHWGAMQTGWVLVGSDWYYMNTDGSMATSQWIDGYYVDASGKMK